MAGYYILFSSRRGRFLLVLLASLENFGGPRTKEETVSFVKRKGFLNLSARDIEPTDKSQEPRWQNELAWARKDAIEHGYLKRGSARGYWELSERGAERLQRFRERLKSGRSQLREGGLLSSEFVRWFTDRS